jgi:hypothetical protein
MTVRKPVRRKVAPIPAAQKPQGIPVDIYFCPVEKRLKIIYQVSA